MDVSYAAAFFAGILSFLSPCVLPLVPPYLCFLAGTSLDELIETGDETSRIAQDVFVGAFLFVLGFSTVFVALGATASAIGQWLAGNLPLLAKIAGVIIIIMGLHFLGVFKIALFHREARYYHESKPAGLLGSYVIGVAFAFGWTPCIGPVLAAILAIAATSENIGYGASMLAVYSLGLGVPFLIASLAVRPFLTFMKRFRRHLGTVEKVMGASLVATGVLFMTGALSEFSYLLLEMFPSLANIG